MGFLMLASLFALALVSQCQGGSCAAPAYQYQYAAPTHQPAALYRLADANGKVWQSADTVALSRHVAAINAQRAPRYFYATPQYASPCAGGSCPR